MESPLLGIRSPSCTPSSCRRRCFAASGAWRICTPPWLQVDHIPAPGFSRSVDPGAGSSRRTSSERNGSVLATFTVVGRTPAPTPPAHGQSPCIVRQDRHEARRSAARQCGRNADSRHQALLPFSQVQRREQTQTGIQAVLILFARF